MGGLQNSQVIQKRWSWFVLHLCIFFYTLWWKSKQRYSEMVCSLTQIGLLSQRVAPLNNWLNGLLQEYDLIVLADCVKRACLYCLCFRCKNWNRDGNDIAELWCPLSDDTMWSLRLLVKKKCCSSQVIKKDCLIQGKKLKVLLAF